MVPIEINSMQQLNVAATRCGWKVSFTRGLNDRSGSNPGIDYAKLPVCMGLFARRAYYAGYFRPTAWSQATNVPACLVAAMAICSLFAERDIGRGRISRDPHCTGTENVVRSWNGAATSAS